MEFTDEKTFGHLIFLCSARNRYFTEMAENCGLPVRYFVLSSRNFGFRAETLGTQPDNFGSKTEILISGRYFSVPSRDCKPGTLFLLLSAGSSTEIGYHLADFYFGDRCSKMTQGTLFQFRDFGVNVKPGYYNLMPESRIWSIYKKFFLKFYYYFPARQLQQVITCRFF